MAIPACPLPEVASSLEPFIRPRQEATTIRQSLQSCLENQLPLEDGTPLSAINLTTPRDSKLEDPPPPLTGVRKAYWKALQANQAAQARYDALKADLDALKRPGPSAADTSPASVNETYIPLLRQKERVRRLRVLERAYASLPTLPADALEDQIKTHVGPQPTPPSSHLPSSSSSDARGAPDVEARKLALKKAILTAQRRVHDQGSRNAVSRASGPEEAELGSGARIAGLQRALQELTGWMEEMLGVIADAEAEAASAATNGSSQPATPGAEASGFSQGPGKMIELDEIETAYERYLYSRRRLIQTLASPPSESGQDHEEPLFPPSASKGTHKAPSKSPAELLLPHIASLTSLRSAESALLAQKSHVRSQISAAEDETARLVHRLAGESHLVQPGASHGAEWAEAGREAAEETDKTVVERVTVGEDCSAKATEALDGIEQAPQALEALLNTRP